MDSGIFFPLFLVLFDSPRRYAIHYLSADLQSTAMFVMRKPLSPKARRPGWQGFKYDLGAVPNGGIVRVFAKGLDA
jgi:hypothetical protein